MNRTIRALVAAMVFLHGLSGDGFGEGTGGIVREVRGGIASIDFAGPAPKAGDRAEIFFEIDGVDEVITVATGKVIEVNAAGTIKVQVDNATGEVAKDQLVRFTPSGGEGTQAGSSFGTATPSPTAPAAQSPPVVPELPPAPFSSYPTTTSGGPAPEAVPAFNRGVEHYERDEYAAAVRTYKEAIEKDPGYAAAHYNLALCYREMHDWKNDLASVERAIALGMTTTPAYELRGEARYWLYKYKEALSDFNRTIEAGDATAKSYMMRAWTRISLRRWDPQILADATKAIDLSGAAIAYDARATYYEHVGNWAGAVADWEKASSLDKRVAKSARAQLEQARIRLRAARQKR